MVTTHVLPREPATTPTPAQAAGFLADLDRQLGDGGLLTDRDQLGRYGSDWSRKEPCAPLAVARPRDAAGVSAVLRHCHSAGWPVVVQGGLTGMVGGATPRRGELALSLERLTGIETVDATGCYLVAGAGATLAAVQDAAAAQGLAFPLDLASRGGCTIGGNIATNAGGNRVVRYGMTRQLVLGLEAVLADGSVLSSLDAMLKNNAGYDLKQLFIGTEGTLGVVTRAVLRLHPEPPERLTALLALGSFDDLAALLVALRARLGAGLCAFEAMWDDYFECALATLGLPRPFAGRHPLYALVEVELWDAVHDRERAQQVLLHELEGGRARDVIVTRSLQEAARLWRVREGAGELLSLLAPAEAYDISMPLARMPGFVADLRERAAPLCGGRPFCAFGHLGDGNLHLLAALRPGAHAAELDALVYGALAGFGSVSAEHGIGASKKRWLGISRSAAEIATMRGLKQHLDPRSILNPGRVL